MKKSRTTISSTKFRKLDSHFGRQSHKAYRCPNWVKGALWPYLKSSTLYESLPVFLIPSIPLESIIQNIKTVSTFLIHLLSTKFHWHFLSHSFQSEESDGVWNRINLSQPHFSRLQLYKTNSLFSSSTLLKISENEMLRNIFEIHWKDERDREVKREREKK